MSEEQIDMISTTERTDIISTTIKKRMKLLIVFFAAAFLFFGLKLVKIMKIDFAYYTMLSESQLTKTLRLRSGYDFTGKIFDRNMNPLVKSGTEYTAVIDPGIVYEHLSINGGQNGGQYDDLFKSICSENSSITEKELKKKIEDEYKGSKGAILLSSSPELNKKISSISLPGIYSVEGTKRYGESSVGSSVTSCFLKNTISNTDLKGEDSVDMKIFKLVAGHVSQTLKVMVDAKGNTIPGVEPVLSEDVKYFEKEPKDVVLTLDKDIQKIAEDTLSEMCSGNGAVTILGAKDGKVLAMASKDDSGFERNMITYSKPNFGYNPGSVFKVVVLEAALEEKLVDYNTQYFCSGISNLNGIRCSKPSGHGLIGLEDAFANSCNVYFIDLAQKVGPEKIIEMAEKFGFGKKVLDFSSESQGMLYKDKKDIKYDTGNIAIGQKDILVTPLQVSNMMETIANDGVNIKPYILEEILNKDGSVDEEYSTTEKRIISKSTARTLQSLLKAVVEKGTGKKAQIPEGASGKTGTPQRGEKTSSGLYSHEDGWFTGYFPSSDPKYVVTVYVEDIMNQPEGNISTLIFKSIAQKMLSMEGQ